MSGLLAGKVWQSDLASHLKPLAAALADIANDDGTSIFPSVAYVSWLLGKGRRSVQVGLAELREMQIIEPIGSDKGGRGQPTEYRLIEANLPNRISWKDLKKGAESARFQKTKGATSDTKGRGFEHERAQFSTQRVNSGAPDPSVTVNQPSEEPLPFSSADFLEAWNDYKQARKEKRQRVTSTIQRALSKKMSLWGEGRSIAALIHSTGYTGLFEPNGSNGNGHKHTTASERNVANIRASMDIIRARSGEPDSAESEREVAPRAHAR
jgi:hypothetical protein